MSKQTNRLKHYGVKGMRWGVRKDRKQSADSKTAETLRRKSLSEMSNKELQTLNQRLNLERQYNSLTEKKTSRGAKIVKDALAEIAKEQLKDAVKKYAPVLLESFKDGYTAGTSAGG